MPNLPEFASNVQCFALRSIVLGSLDKAPPEPGSVVVHGVDPNFLMAPPRNPVRTSTPAASQKRKSSAQTVPGITVARQVKKAIDSTQALLTEAEVAYTAKATALTGAKAKLARAKNDMAHAALEEQRAASR